MAEGGTTDNPTIVSSETSIPIDPRLTECPICLEQLRHPKSLPCLHTFCEECLNIYITKESDTPMLSFTCPVCRAETVPVDPKEKKGHWAKQFPTNNFIVEMSKVYVKKSQIHECDPCRKRDVRNIAATVWWKESNRFLCGTCLGTLHDVIGEDHTLVEVTTGRKFLPTTSPTYTYCPKHKNVMDLYCEDHQSVCCSTCIAVAHRRCDVVITLSEYGERVRSSAEIQDMRTRLQEVADAMESLTQDIRKQTQHLGDGRDQVMKQIISVRQKFEAQLAKLQQNITDELVTTYKEEKQQLDDMLDRCERMQNGIKTTQILSEADVIQKDDIQMISTLQRGRMEIKSCQDLITQVTKAFTIVELNFEHDDAHRVIDKTLTLGRLNVKRTRRNVAVNQVLNRPLSCAQAKHTGKLCIKTASDKKDWYTYRTSASY